MEKKKIIIVLLAIIIPYIIFSLLYNFDNKYTLKGEQPINGILDLRETSKDFTFLIYDWEYYPNNIYTPSDFSSGRPPSYMEYISIGERASMNRNSAFGKGTYRLTVLLPSVERNYAVLLPEIFSAYNLYIDNKLILKMGDIENNTPEIQNRLITFDAKNKVQILINVSSFSHYYSGMVYPPAIGSPKALNTLRGLNIFICVFIFALAFICFILSLYIRTAMRQKNINVFMLISLLFCLYVFYPITHNYFSCSGETVYITEICLNYALYTFIILLQSNICEINRYVKTTAFFGSLFVCFAAFVTAVFSEYVGIELRYYVSVILEIYKWLFGIYITFSTVYSFFKSKKNNIPLLIGTLFFSVSLISDRIYTLYEPIYGKYFIEIGITALVFSQGYLLWKDIADSYIFRLTFGEQQRQMKKQIEIHKNNYEHINKNIEETRKLQHDMRQHIRVINELADNGNVKEIKKYIGGLEKIQSKKELTTFSENTTINALLQYYYCIYSKNNILFEVNFEAEKNIDFPDIDITIILGNLLENAAEACLRQKSGEKNVKIKGKLSRQDLIFKISNTFDAKPVKTSDGFLSLKNGCASIGLKSINSIIKKYNGIIDIEYKNNIFVVYANITIQQ